MNQIAIAGDLLAEKRREAARKAVETRRARAAGGGAVPQIVSQKFTRADDALDAFEQESRSASPDWHRAALLLRQALESRPSSKVLTIKAPKAVALPAPAWPDYPVNHLGWQRCRSPTVTVTFADGEVVRAPAVSARDKPLNIGRGLRVAIAFYQARMAWRSGRSALDFACEVPDIASCICEETGETFDPELCTMRTIENRKAISR